jgi:hypothetical protein
VCDLALARTGFDPVLPLALGALLVFAGVAVLLLRGRRSRSGGMLALVLIAGSLLALASSPAPAMAADCPSAADGQQATAGALAPQGAGGGSAQGPGGSAADPVTSAPATAVLIGSPTALTLAAGDSGTFDISNVSAVTANDVIASMVPVPGITIDWTTCFALVPNATCTLRVSTSSGFTGGAVLSVAGTNTNTLQLSVELLPPSTVVTGPSATAFAGSGTQDVQLTNTGSERATFGTPSLTGSGDLTTDLGSCVAGLAPGDSCVAHVTSPRSRVTASRRRP